MNQKDRMTSSLPYKDDTDGLPEDRLRARTLLHEFNLLPPTESERRKEILHELLGSHGEHIRIEQPFHCDYGYNIEVGEGFFSNFNLTILDCAAVRIGCYAMLGPNVTISPAGHPIHPLSRTRAFYEYALPVTIGDRVWIGANVVINPGITIGDNAVIGSGSVVTRDIPPDVVAAGNPCRVLRAITDEDMKYYWRDREFDIPMSEVLGE